MLKELKQIDELTNALKAVETAIGFLSSHGGNPNMLYMEYLDKNLRYDPKQYLTSKSVRMFLTYFHTFVSIVVTILDKDNNT